MGRLLKPSFGPCSFSFCFRLSGARLAWGRYFTSIGVDFVFFSAKNEREKLYELEKDMNEVDGVLGASKLDRALMEQAAAGAGAGAGGPLRASDFGSDVESSDGEDGGEGEESEEEDGEGAGEGSSEEEGSEEEEEEEEGEGEGEEATGAGAGVGAGVGTGAGADASAAGVSPAAPPAVEEKEEANPEAALITKCRVVGREELIDMLTAKRQELLGGPDDDSSSVGSGKASAAKGTGAAGGEEGAEVEEEVEGADAPEMRPLCVGLVGYPNVGKSSTINALMGATSIAHGVKRVGVGSTPGKTKHFQVR